MSIGGQAFSQNAAPNKSAPVKVTEGIYRIRNYGCNIAVIPGHGAPSDRQGLVDYRNMLAKARTNNVH